MVDANQQWDRPTAMRVSRALEEFNLVWIEEPLDAYDAEGHAQLAAPWTPPSPPARCSPASPNTTS
jgi:L-alanine-DL-glutamate epimerase-like enolase superfamily enzyme